MNSDKTIDDYRHIRGFTLLEVAVCVGIIAFFAIMAVPLYRNFTVRAKIVELKSLAHGATLSIDHFVQTTGRLPNNTAELNLATSGKPKYLQEIKWENDILTLIGNAEKLGLKTGEALSLIYTPVVIQGGIRWKCETQGPKKYAPANCPSI